MITFPEKNKSLAFGVTKNLLKVRLAKTAPRSHPPPSTVLNKVFKKWNYMCGNC